MADHGRPQLSTAAHGCSRPPSAAHGRPRLDDPPGLLGFFWASSVPSLGLLWSHPGPAGQPRQPASKPIRPASQVQPGSETATRHQPTSQLPATSQSPPSQVPTITRINQEGRVWEGELLGPVRLSTAGYGCPRLDDPAGLLGPFWVSSEALLGFSGPPLRLSRTILPHTPASQQGNQASQPAPARQRESQAKKKRSFKTSVHQPTSQPTRPSQPTGELILASQPQRAKQPINSQPATNHQPTHCQ